MRGVFIANKSRLKVGPIFMFFFLFYVACFCFGLISLFAMPNWLRERILSIFQPFMSSLHTHLSSKTFVSTMIFVHASYGVLFLFLIWLLGHLPLKRFAFLLFRGMVLGALTSGFIVTFGPTALFFVVGAFSLTHLIEESAYLIAIFFATLFVYHGQGSDKRTSWRYIVYGMVHLLCMNALIFASWIEPIMIGKCLYLLPR
jgi:hypothetical protein